MRLFGIGEHLYYCCSLSPSLLNSVFGDSTDTEKQRSTSGIKEEHENFSGSPTSKDSKLVCSLCLGILQSIYCDDKKLVVKKNSAKDLAISIAELVKEEGYQIEGFSLEVSLPPVIAENESSVW